MNKSEFYIPLISLRISLLYRDLNSYLCISYLLIRHIYSTKMVRLHPINILLLSLLEIQKKSANHILVNKIS